MTDSTAAADPALVSLAAALAKAEIAAAEATDAHRAAEADRDNVRARISELDAARREIGSRRAAGHLLDDDRADLAILATDIEALGVILAERDAAAAAVRAEAERAIRTLDQRRHDLAREEALRTAAALDRHLEALGGLLLAGIQEANGIARRLGRGMPDWRPSAALMGALVPLDPRWRT